MRIKKYIRIILEMSFNFIIFVAFDKKEREEFNLSSFRLEMLSSLEEWNKHIDDEEIESIKPKRSPIILKPKEFNLKDYNQT